MRQIYFLDFTTGTSTTLKLFSVNPPPFLWLLRRDLITQNTIQCFNCLCQTLSLSLALYFSSLSIRSFFKYYVASVNFSSLPHSHAKYFFQFASNSGEVCRKNIFDLLCLYSHHFPPRTLFSFTFYPTMYLCEFFSQSFLSLSVFIFTLFIGVCVANSVTRWWIKNLPNFPKK